MMRKFPCRTPPKKGEVLGYDFSCYFDNPDCNILSREDEMVLTNRAYYGDREAANKLLLANVRWVISLASRFVRWKRHGFLIEDAVQAGVFGLRTAIDKFQPARGLRLATYATAWIIQSMQHERTKYLLIHVPAHYWSKKSASNVQDPDCRIKAKNALRVTEFSDIERANLWSDRMSGYCAEDWIADNSEKIVVHDPPPADPLPRHEDIGWLMRGLNDREKTVIRRRFHDKGTLRGIGDELGISKERVRQIELRAIKRMQERAKLAEAMAAA